MAKSLTRFEQTATLTGVVVFVFFSGYVAGRHAASRADATSIASPSASRTDSTRLTPAVPARQRSPVVDVSRAAAADSEIQRCDRLRELATRDPSAALAQVAVERNWRLRRLLRNAVLRGWSSREPMSAAEFTLTLPESDREDAATAVFEGAGAAPRAATAAAARLCACDPARAVDYGRGVIAALAAAGAFPALLDFAAADGTGHTSEFLNATFNDWAQRDPQSARAAMAALPEANRPAAFEGLLIGWSIASPPDLAAYAATLPPGETRSLAMQQALSQWSLRDPVAAASWMSTFDPSPEFDASVATIAARPEIAIEQPLAALGWAQSILDPTLRGNTLLVIGREWAGHDASAARKLIDQATGVTPEDRAKLIEGLELGREE